ncbi:NADAR family protein [Cronobacter muytjensii]|uniref:NADAR family protein n=1 Tax=Cronobacter muytjensii TaxID=413501 RepID=UPI002DBA11FB|nr:NADAR family protein [Cronobacter muytjensii]MEB8638630.1 NADAR family protein [Cronobacter muytjensii]
MNYRLYPQMNTIAFRKTTEKWGGLSNMAKGYALLVNDLPIQSSEILYQACRYPDHPHIQKAIITQGNPYEAKQTARAYETHTRSGWEKNRVSIMKWCVCVKLCQNWDAFFTLLDSTGEQHIVEHSEKDQFWGASKDPEGNFYGMNVLGRILMNVREVARSKGPDAFAVIPPLHLDNFLLMNEKIRQVTPPTNLPIKGQSLSLF